MSHVEELPTARMITALVPEETIERMQALASTADRSFSAEVRRALRAHVDASTTDDDEGSGA